jgi:hypothetical protein
LMMGEYNESLRFLIRIYNKPDQHKVAGKIY